jgi:dienelactone hydrolase
MRRVDVQIPAPDGRSRGTLHLPDGDGPWPGVLVFPDAGGVRETFRQMGDRLAGMGYVALIPDIYYRAGQWAPFDVATLFTDEQERARLFRLTGALTNERIIADAGAYSGFLLARPEVTGSAIGTTGYCLGGRMSLIAAGGLGHGFAVPDNPTYDAQADARHWEALHGLYRAHLQGSLSADPARPPLSSGAGATQRVGHGGRSRAHIAAVRYGLLPDTARVARGSEWSFWAPPARLGGNREAAAGNDTSLAGEFFRIRQRRDLILFRGLRLA